MRASKATRALVVVLVAAMCAPAFARGNSGGGHSGGGRSGGAHFSGGASHGGRAPSGTIGFGNLGAHPYTGVRPPVAPRAHPAPPPRYYGGGARIGVVVGAPLLFAPLMYSAPAYYYSPPTTYVEQEPAYVEPAPAAAYWYFCPQLNAYYPYVQECPGGWQAVLPQPPG